MIIFLNGASSAGKSTIAREIMHQSPRPFLYYSINHLVEFWLDEKFILSDDEPQAWLYQQFNLIESETHSHIDGPDINQLRWDMIEALQVLIKKGYDLIIDEILWDQSIFAHYTQALSFAKQVYMVRIDCDLIECEARERKRSDRFIGLTRSSYAQVYGSHPYYDFAVDTTTHSAKKAAQKILAFTQEQPHPMQFAHSLQVMITFEPLKEQHFKLLKKWLNTQHVARWWNENERWTLAAVRKKYDSYIKGYKVQDASKKPLSAFIVKCGLWPIGYIQFYNAYDFPRTPALEHLPVNLAALDFYIGEPSYLKRGLSTPVLKQFLETWVWPRFDACLVDPDNDNILAIQAYRRAGFEIIPQQTPSAVTWMIKKSGKN